MYKQLIKTILIVLLFIALNCCLIISPGLSDFTNRYLDDFMYSIEPTNSSEEYICFTDSSCANCTVISSCGMFYMINCGSDINSDAILSFLEKLQVKTIEFIIITHPVARNMNGLISISKQITVNNVYFCGVVSYDTQTADDLINLINYTDYNNINTRFINQDTSFSVNSLKFEIFCCNDSHTRKSDNSAIIKISCNNQTFLLVNETSCKSEVDFYEKDIRSDTLIYSGTMNYEALTEHFINLVNPKSAIISLNPNSKIDYENEFCKTLLKKNIPISKTAISGNIFLPLKNNNLN